ncbi:MAG TPA: hypothetical protein VNE60_11100 [Gemmatimonadaceae bacterium]|nr:hypothetical protein [Gemmatimonadaceae bacterium]
MQVHQCRKRIMVAALSRENELPFRPLSVSHLYARLRNRWSDRSSRHQRPGCIHLELRKPPDGR